MFVACLLRSTHMGTLLFIDHVWTILSYSESHQTVLIHKMHGSFYALHHSWVFKIAYLLNSKLSWRVLKNNHEISTDTNNIHNRPKKQHLQSDVIDLCAACPGLCPHRYINYAYWVITTKNVWFTHLPAEWVIISIGQTTIVRRQVETRVRYIHPPVLYIQGMGGRQQLSDDISMSHVFMRWRWQCWCRWLELLWWRSSSSQTRDARFRNVTYVERTQLGITIMLLVVPDFELYMRSTIHHIQCAFHQAMSVAINNAQYDILLLSPWLDL